MPFHRRQIFVQTTCLYHRLYRARTGIAAHVLQLALAGAALLLIGGPGVIAADTDRPVTIVTLGDSITKGVRKGVTKDQTFAATLERRFQEEGRNARIINVGIGGERTDQALKRLDIIKAHNPKVVTIMYGTNDSYVDRGKSSSRISLDAYRANLNKIVIELLRLGILPVLMTEPRWSEKAAPNGLGENPNRKLEPYMEACRQVAATWRLPLVDHFSQWTAARDSGVSLHDWTTDGCHPNAAGHEVIAKAVFPVLEKAVYGPGTGAKGTGAKTLKKLRTRKPVRVVCFGDSVTGVYYHTGSRRAYTTMLGIALRSLHSHPDVEMINAGVSGNTTSNGLARIEQEVLARKPDLVTVMFGLNDMVRIPLTTYRENLEKIVRKCRDSGADVVLATPNNVIDTPGRPTARLIEYCDVVRQVGREMKVPVADCYREFDAVRAHDRFEWRLLMSDEIHPNMDGHRRIALLLADTIGGRRTPLHGTPSSHVPDPAPFQPALKRTLGLLRAGKPVRVLAMTPADTLIEQSLKVISPRAKVEITKWPVGNLSLREIEQEAKARVRKLRPDLVIIAAPRSAAAESREEFVRSYSWIMNWSLNFGPPTWDCVVVHPSVFEPERSDERDPLVRQLVRAQDLSLIESRSTTGSQRPTAMQIFHAWFKQQAELDKKPGGK